MDGSSNVTVLIWSFGQSSSHNQLDTRLTAHCCLISAHESLQSRDTAQGATLQTGGSVTVCYRAECCSGQISTDTRIYLVI